LTFSFTKLLLMGWLKLNEKLFAPDGTVTGVNPGVLLTPPALLTQVTPQITSKVRDGFVPECPTILTNTLTLVIDGLATIAVHV